MGDQHHDTKTIEGTLNMLATWYEALAEGIGAGDLESDLDVSGWEHDAITWLKAERPELIPEGISPDSAAAALRTAFMLAEAMAQLGYSAEVRVN